MRKFNVTSPNPPQQSYSFPCLYPFLFSDPFFSILLLALIFSDLYLRSHPQQPLPSSTPSTESQPLVALPSPPLTIYIYSAPLVCWLSFIWLPTASHLGLVIVDSPHSPHGEGPSPLLGALIFTRFANFTHSRVLVNIWV